MTNKYSALLISLGLYLVVQQFNVDLPLKLLLSTFEFWRSFQQLSAVFCFHSLASLTLGRMVGALWAGWSVSSCHHAAFIGKWQTRSNQVLQISE
jgi:hypothetical protein